MAMVTASLPGSTGEGAASGTAMVQIGETEGTTPALSITVSPNTISLTESADVTALARNSDGSLYGSGGSVSLRTDLGTLVSGHDASCAGSQSTSITVTTNSNSEGQATLCPGARTGTATVTGSIGSSAEVTATVTIGETTETLPTLSITASPNRINIEETSTISVIARNSDGSRLANATVSLRASLGDLSNTTLTTDSNGEASATLTPDGRSGMVNLTGSVGASAEVVLEAAVTILQTQVIVQVTPSTLDVMEMATVTILARDEDNIPLLNGYDVRLTANLGTFDDATVRTNTSDGSTSANYTAGNRAGTDTITAFLGNSEPATAMVAIRDAPADFSLQVDSRTIESGGGDIVATVTVVNDRDEGLQSILVRFNTVGVGGTFTPGASVLTDSRGIAQTTLTVTESELTNVDDFELTATVTINGDPVTKSETITVQN
jgi:adhesin/invasin